jgi:uncharacterized protein (DUF302 family)
MKKLSAILLMTCYCCLPTLAQETGLVTMASARSVRETADRFIETVTSKGLTVFARIDHAENATKQNLQLRPTELILFGNPKAGTPLMQDNQVSGIDLPLKVLIWEDEQGKVWLTYNDPKWIGKRHGLSDQTDKAIGAMEEGIKAMTSSAVSE